MRITILGLGEIGTANKAHFESQGHIVTPYDPPKGLTELAQADLYVICTPSHIIEKSIDTILAFDRNPTISIESTIIDFGLTDRLSERVPRLCYCPQRYWAADPEHRGVVRFRLLASPTTLLHFKDLYWKQLGIRTLPVSPIVAEYAKVTENAYRALQIAFAQELKLKTGRHFEQVRHAVMTADNMHYLPEARAGIGGHCLPLAMDTLKDLPLIAQAILSNENYKTESE